MSLPTSSMLWWHWGRDLHWSWLWDTGRGEGPQLQKINPPCTLRTWRTVIQCMPHDAMMIIDADFPKSGIPFQSTSVTNFGESLLTMPLMKISERILCIMIVTPKKNKYSVAVTVTVTFEAWPTGSVVRSDVRLTEIAVSVVPRCSGGRCSPSRRLPARLHTQLSSLNWYTVTEWNLSWSPARENRFQLVAKILSFSVEKDKKLKGKFYWKAKTEKTGKY